jgi:hypothetical protein
MATNGYCDLADLRRVNKIRADDNTLDLEFDAAISAASRQIDRFCGRRFWQDGSVVTREFFPDNGWNCYVDDISTTVGLIVKVDTGDNGFVTSATTLTITSDFILLPANAADEVPVWPYTQLRITTNSTSAFTLTQRPTVQVTAKFGWPAIPDDIQQACILQAQQLYKGAGAPFGGLEIDSIGRAMPVRSGLNPIAQALCQGYVKL